MKSHLARLGILGTAFLIGGATAAYADDSLEEALACADYISSGAMDGPASGHLIGSQTVTVVTSGGSNANVSVGGGPAPVSAGAGINEQTTVTVVYEVGYYRMNDGSTLKIDCRTYSIIR